MTELKREIESSLKYFSKGNLLNNSQKLLNTLGYLSDKTFTLSPNNYDGFKEHFANPQINFDSNKARTKEWKSIDIIFQLTEEEIKGQNSLFDSTQVDNTIMESYLFFVIHLTGAGKEYTRGDLVKITREINKLTPMPAMILFRYSSYLTISIIDRRLHKRESSKDVLEKVTLIKDININQPHRAHIEILHDLALSEIIKAHAVTNFVDLHNAWRKTLNISELNERFYREIANWYFWAVKKVKFPDDTEKDEDVRNATNVIRLITRLIFIWFVKEKGLIHDDLFNQNRLKGILKLTDKNNSAYYKAILQNLFFATLNTEMNKDNPGSRKFRYKAKKKGKRDQHYMIHNLFRYADCFINHGDSIKKYFDNIPFLNGGLFECLDKKVITDGKDKVIRIDAFSESKNNVLKVPDELFFSSEQTIDLNEIYGTRNKQYKVRGLIDILNSYKFTITENTPVEEEIALDPELLGKVFENLLASYNPETKTTARKQTGSYYTPREIVNYMVNESLIAYLSNIITIDSDSRLRSLFAYTEEPHKFIEQEVDRLIEGIDNIKILDPACGSGAFPMGILHKMVYILGKLDPDNKKWKQKQISKVLEIPDSTVREKLLEDIEQSFQNNELDYGRKLYLIENCIYGADIQPIACQIAKLRFFISLIVDQKTNSKKENLGIRPLPNLETKFVAANTLIKIESQINLRSSKIIEKEKELKQVREKHFSARTSRTKNKYRNEDLRVRGELVELFKNIGFSEETRNKLVTWEPYDQNTSADFFDSEWMFGIRDGFDVVIGNPPYIKEYTHRNAFNGARNSPYYQGKMDIWYLFACQGLDISKTNSGILTFIATNNWVTNYGASKMRNKIIKNAKIEKLLDFGSYMIFESSDIQTMVMIFRNQANSDSYKFDYRKLNGATVAFNDVLDLISLRNNPKAEYLTPTIKKETLTNKTLTFSSNKIENVLKKIASKANFRLNEKKEVAQGIVAPQDYLNKKSLQLLKGNFKVGDGIFYLTEDEKNKLALTKDELKFIKSFYSTDELGKYFGSPANKRWVIYTSSIFKEPLMMEPFPNIKKHLDKFKIVITSVNAPYGLHRARREYFFKGEKIISLRKCLSPTFTYTDFDCYVSQTHFVIKTNRINLKYLTTLLNSKLIEFWLRRKGKMQGNNYQIDKEPILNIPIIKPDSSEPFEQLVDQILTVKQKDQQADTKALEKQIDIMVYKLYGLTYEEVKIVDPEFKMAEETYSHLENMKV